MKYLLAMLVVLCSSQGLNAAIIVQYSFDSPGDLDTPSFYNSAIVNPHDTSVGSGLGTILANDGAPHGKVLSVPQSNLSANPSSTSFYFQLDKNGTEDISLESFSFDIKTSIGAGSYVEFKLVGSDNSYAPSSDVLGSGTFFSSDSAWQTVTVSLDSMNDIQGSASFRLEFTGELIGSNDPEQLFYIDNITLYDSSEEVATVPEPFSVLMWLGFSGVAIASGYRRTLATKKQV